MRQSKMTKAMALMLSLVMITSVFVGNTLSRYVTSVSSTDNARVAVWGINGETVTMELFKTAYDLDGKKIAESNNKTDKIIAPGTGGQSAFSIINFESDTIPPEVAYQVKIDLDDSEVDEKIKNNTSIQWKLDNNSWSTWDEMIASVLLLSGDPSGIYEYAPGTFANAFKGDVEHKISWQWVMDNGNNETDTQMGIDALAGDISAKISVRVTAEQSDGSSVNMLNGANQTVNLYNPEPAVFRSAAPKADFESVVVDNETVDPSNYEVTEGSTVITFNTDYLASLSEGTHTIKINSKNDFVAEAKFYVVNNVVPIVHNNVIPEGGTYYVGAELYQYSEDHVPETYVGDYHDYTAKYEAGDEFPKTVNVGDVYVYGDYEYRYGLTGERFDIWYLGSFDGWGVQYVGSLEEPGKILTTINGKDVICINYTFFNSFNLEKAPIIPSTVIYMNNTFEGCSELTGTIEINSNPTNYYHIFDGTIKPITLTGSSSILEDLASAYDNITVAQQ